MPLTMAPEGRMLKILKVMAEEKTKRHLENLGILAGGTIEVVSEERGSVILKVKEARLALDKQIAIKILVA